MSKTKKQNQKPREVFYEPQTYKGLVRISQLNILATFVEETDETLLLKDHCGVSLVRNINTLELLRDSAALSDDKKVRTEKGILRTLNDLTHELSIVTKAKFNSELSADNPTEISVEKAAMSVENALLMYSPKEKVEMYQKLYNFYISKLSGREAAETYAKKIGQLVKLDNFNHIQKLDLLRRFTVKGSLV